MISRRDLLLGSLAMTVSPAAKCAAGRQGSFAPPGTVRSVEDLEEACRVGGNYVVLPGIYVLGDKVLRPVSGTRLTGTPGRTILKKRTSPGPYRTRAFFDIENAKDITLEGLVFDHHAARTELGVILRATSPGAAGRVTLLNNIFRRCHVHIGRFVEDVRVKDCRFLGEAIALGGISTGGDLSKVNGKFLGSNGAVRNIVLENLYFERTVTEAIDINWHTQNVRAANITCVNCNTGGVDEVIDIGGDINATEANRCRNIRFSKVLIRNDAAGPTETIAVHVKGGSRDIEFRDLKILRRNEVGSGSAGVRVWNSNDARFDGVVVDGCASGIVSAARGQYLPQRLRFTNVTVRNYDGEAIQLEGKDCVLDGFDIDGTGTASQAIDLIAFTDSTIRNGRIRTSGRTGIRVQRNCSRVSIDNVTVNGSPSGKKLDVRGRDVRVSRIG
jgi:hypothetical protein